MKVFEFKQIESGSNFRGDYKVEDTVHESKDLDL